MNESHEATTFLHALYGPEASGWLEIRYLVDDELPARRWYKPQNVPLDKLEVGNKTGRNVYFGVGLRRKKSGSKADVLSIPALWVDLDEKDYPGGKADALHVLEGLPSELAPSIVLDSGHGIHGYWLLQAPIPLADGTADRVETTLRGLAVHLGGDTTVADVARIMRLPGFLNVKDQENPVPCSILAIHPDRVFDIEAFSAFRELAASPAVIPTETPTRPRLPAWALDFLARGAIEGERNTIAFNTACQLRDAGYSEPETLARVVEGAARCTPPLAEREVKAAVKSAYSKPPREPIPDRKAKKAAPSPGQAVQVLTKPENAKAFDFFIAQDGTPILFRWKTSRDGSIAMQEPIARFVPRIVSETVRHKPDGETLRIMHTEIRTWRSKVIVDVIPDVIADPRRFYGACVSAVGGDARLIDPGAQRYLPQAAMELAPDDRKREPVYEMTGWQEVDGCLCYLSPAGGINAPDGVKVDLSNLEAGIGLAQDGLSIGGVADQGDDAFQAGIAALLSPVLECFPRSVMLPALGFTFLAPLMRWSPIPDRPALHFVGSTGTRKTALLSILQAFYGCPRFLLSWQSTGNSLEIAMSQTRDMLVTVDDLKATTSDRGVGRRVLQSYADRRGRGRATAKGELARARFAGGLLVSAGEDIPEGEASIAARSLFVTIRKGDADLNRLTEAQGAIGSLPTLTARYIAWLIEQGDAAIRARVADTVVIHRDYYRGYMAELQGINDAGRVATSCALILTGAGCLLDFLVSVGALSPQGRDDLFTETQLTLLDLAHSQARVMVEETYAQTFLSAVHALLETKQAYLVPLEDGQAPMPLEEARTPVDYPPSAKIIGWKKADGEIWLRPPAVWGEVGNWLTRQGRIRPTAEGTYLQLDDGGLIARKSGDRRLYATRAGDTVTKVLALTASALDET